MTTRLFDDIERKDTGPEPESGVDYEYLNHSDRPEIEKIRSLLEDWFNRYPKEAQDEFLERFKGVEHAKAFFELYIHEILCKQGSTCRVHPEIEGSNTHPEFLVSDKGLDFYVEATMPDLPQDDAINQRLCDELIDELNKTPSEYYLDVDFEGLLRNRPSPKEIKAWLKNKPSVGSSFELKQDSAKIVVTILSAKKGTNCGENVGIVEYGAVWGSPGAAMIRRAIHKKSSHYGNLGKPYLIAINVSNVRPLIHDSHVANAIFGDLCVRINPKTKEHSYRRNLRTAKLLTLGGEPEHTRVSGIIILKNLGPWNIVHTTPVLWHNPGAELPFPPELWQLPQQIPKEVYEKKEGKAVSELLGLPPNWPEG